MKSITEKTKLLGKWIVDVSDTKTKGKETQVRYVGKLGVIVSPLLGDLEYIHHDILRRFFGLVERNKN